jgi:aminoglycoside phosphotransferase (APT) family kinase protein
MSTIGHPLSDLANLLGPYVTAASETALEIGRGSTAFQPGVTEGLPTREQLVEWYREVAGWDPAPDMHWGDAFGIFKGSVIMQGIAARYAMRQASSARAIEYAVQMKPWAEIGWGLIRSLKEKQQAEKAKL